MNEQSAVETNRVRWAIAALSVVVCAAVWIAITAGGSNDVAPPEPTLLANINVFLNGSSGVLLLLGYSQIRRGHREAHRRSMLGAFGLSSCFLITYLLHHSQVGSVPFRGTGAIRVIYYAILIPHVLLAAGIVPLALLTIYRAWTGRFPAHRKIARWTFPLWLYVSSSGVLIYLLLYHAS